MWALVAMAGVAYFVQPQNKTQRYVMWGCIVFTGVFIAGFGLMLNWTQSERVQAWARGHPRLVRILLVLAVLVSALKKLSDIISHK